MPAVHMGRAAQQKRATPTMDHTRIPTMSYPQERGKNKGPEKSHTHGRAQRPLSRLPKQAWVPATSSDPPGGVTKMLHSDVRRGSHISHGNAGAL